MDGVNRLVSTRGPHLTWLGMTIPVEVHLEEAVDGMYPLDVEIGIVQI